MIMDFLWKKNFIVVLLANINGTWQKVNLLKFQILPKQITLKNRTYVIDISLCTYKIGGKFVYFMDALTGNQFLLEKGKEGINPESLDLMLRNKIIKEITSGILQNNKEKLITMIIGALIGACIASIIVMSIYQGKIESILKENAFQPIDIGV